jgi:hypothetical protein
MLSVVYFVLWECVRGEIVEELRMRSSGRPIARAKIRMRGAPPLRGRSKVDQRCQQISEINE